MVVVAVIVVGVGAGSSSGEAFTAVSAIPSEVHHRPRTVSVGPTLKPVMVEHDHLVKFSTSE